ncbi:hypothetical protein [Streptomyces albidochromogenes]|uniref:Uncharacterized protein n=1 Tax=Streptomyces albidochromogenes TaxID=329524 RepID=A0ABW6FHU9_9ACTN
MRSPGKLTAWFIAAAAAATAGLGITTTHPGEFSASPPPAAPAPVAGLPEHGGETDAPPAFGDLPWTR